MSVGGGEGAQEGGGVEEPGVEEVGGLAAGFEGVGAEGKDGGGEADGEEVGFVSWGWRCRGGCHCQEMCDILEPL